MQLNRVHLGHLFNAQGNRYSNTRYPSVSPEGLNLTSVAIDSIVK